MIMHTIVQFICFFFSLLAVGQAVNKEATKFEKIEGWIVCIIFLLLILYIEGALKC